ncbi:carboxylesterase/lipase family protein [Plantactinospora sp. KLBMP9567]|uniref:carboxylesterase/lipase family protein n=1 Tax=Plantactinospora sp. KLBMP9567 TaxID=3085900 RepID=UPI0029818DE8|nr:carboxylesterase family protein [Plantactinospora sp. KLBMP9567]MDW5322317.1 carboxylesterase family protein [Plantactinospora sp. KLBMP9567]
MNLIARNRLFWVAAPAILTAMALPPASSAEPSRTRQPDRAVLARIAEPEANITEPEVRVEAGTLRGEAGTGAVRFSGIPYATAPVGNRRWTAARPARPWLGVRDATSPGPICPQAGRDEQNQPIVLGEEDCLYLDVVSPTRPTRPGRLPVIVWLHGGNFNSGAGSQFDGARIATGGDVVVVTVNYRLGALGFLSSASLDAEGTISGSYGLLDQAEALRWVRRNITAFGGDPTRVTLAGQSAGARAICAHLSSPTSRGLFQRAILQSGACANPVMTRTDADRKGVEAIRQAGCDDATDIAGCLRSVPVGDLVHVLADPNRPVTGQRRDDPWGPIAGTPFLPRQPIDAIRHGAAARVPLLIGSTHDEMRGFVLTLHRDLTAEGYAEVIRSAFGNRAEDVLREYLADDFASPALALATVLTDWGGGIGACPVLDTVRTASRYAPVYAYEFLDGAPPFGAYHGWDLPFLWDTSIPRSQYPDYAEMTPEQRRLSQAMIDYWTTFAHRGDPNTAGRTPWARAHRGTTAVLGLAAETIASTPFATDHRCRFWDGS